MDPHSYFADPDPEGKMNAEPCGFGSTALFYIDKILKWRRKIDKNDVTFRPKNQERNNILSIGQGKYTGPD